MLVRLTITLNTEVIQYILVIYITEHREVHLQLLLSAETFR
jgi:hypothetical protein